MNLKPLLNQRHSLTEEERFVNMLVSIRRITLFAENKYMHLYPQMQEQLILKPLAHLRQLASGYGTWKDLRTPSFILFLHNP